jgi:nucleosome binding factor SPN SPT16 subunit
MDTFSSLMLQAVSRYLLGYDFNPTVFVLTRTELHVLTSEKKAKILEPVQALKGTLKMSIHM